ncbi:DUF4442 domain-containing protein [Glaciecola siphonariae]|uniref:DUF4442 domain-containing protein n=1 Tax=Glaciecola siphonariae TaxID=521012 RepID=A0ABV9LQR7_9ALTE
MKKQFTELCSISERQSQLVLEGKPRVKNHVNTIHAGALFTLAQQSLIAKLKTETNVPTDTKGFCFTIFYKKPARGLLRASTECITQSRDYLTKIYDNNEIIVVEITAKKSGQESVHV